MLSLQMKKEQVNASLRKWFLNSKRSLPWRDEKTPYRVWISEVMLQQTQASVVVPYFNRWMRLFPTIQSLAHASWDKVLKAWEGLGYYSRARHLHEAAKTVVTSYHGELPDDEAELSNIKGLGPYTRAAILSFAFHKKYAPIDGNVARLLSRFFLLEKDIGSTSARKELKNLANSLLPSHEPWIISEALIELGALVCQKDPKCNVCPIQSDCLAFRHGLQYTLPQRRQRPAITQLHRTVAVITCHKKILVQQREKRKVMGDLYEFPYLEKTEQILSDFEHFLGFPLSYIRDLPIQSHSFTRYRATLYPHLFATAAADSRYQWIEKDELPNYPFSSGHRRILATLTIVDSN